MCCSVGKVRLDTALELSQYLSRETAIMPVTQGFGELVPLYKLMEKRDLVVVENQMKVREDRIHIYSIYVYRIHLIYIMLYWPVLQVLSSVSCLFKPPLMSSPLCCDWSADLSWLWMLCKQTKVVGFQFLFSFFTPSVSLSNTSVQL